MAKLSEAKTAADALLAASEYIWWERANAGRADTVDPVPCPAHLRMKPQDAAAFLAGGLNPSFLTVTISVIWPGGVGLLAQSRDLPQSLTRVLEEATADELRVFLEVLATGVVQTGRIAVEAKNDGLLELVKVWQAEQPAPTQPDRRRNGILPKQFATRHKPNQAYLPGLVPSPRLPGPVTMPPDRVYLPGLAPVDAGLEQHAIMQLYDGVARQNPKAGHAPTEMRLFTEAVLSYPARARAESYVGLRRLVIGVTEIVTLWLQWQAKHYRPGKASTGQALLNALLRLRSLAVPLNPKGGFYFPVTLEAVSDGRLNLGDAVSFVLSLPPGSQVGPPVDRSVLRAMGRVSGAAYRAYLALCLDWDRRGGHHGRLIRPHKMLHGKRVENPLITVYPAYGIDDLVQLCYPHGALDDKTHRPRLRKGALQAVRSIAAASGCVIQPLEDIDAPLRRQRWRILPPDRVS